MSRTILTLLLCLWALPASAKEYHVTRFDARIEVQPGGSLKVTETVIFMFEDGTFREVFRVIPRRRTDGIEFLSATMDGVVLPPGTAAGQAEVARKGNGLRVTWHFPPTSESRHTFELSYIAHGVVRQEGRQERLEWMALPREHKYRIDASRVELHLPAEPDGLVGVDDSRVDGGPTVDRDGRVLTISASDIRRNGRFTISIPFARGAILDGPPKWQARQAAQREKSPYWLAAAGAIVTASLVVLFGMRRSDDPPPSERSVEWTSLIPPDSLAPALAGALVSNGQLQLQHAMATVFSLADRGVVTIREEPRGVFGQRNFVIQRTRAGEHLAPHEETVLDIIFAKSSGAEASVTVAKARSYLMSAWSRLKKEVARELAAAGLTDRARLAHRHRYMMTGITLLVIAGAAVVPCVLLTEAHGGWPFLVPAAFAIGGLASFIFMSAHTPLSNDGVRRAEQWRAYKKHLSDPQGIESRWGASGPAEARILPFAVALGLAGAWAKFMKKGAMQTPGWFHAAAGTDPGPAFSVFIASGGAGAHGGGAGGGGGAAGGGASGAG